MPIPTTIADLSTTANSNSPQGSESPTEGDNYIRALSAIIAQEHANLVSAGTAFVWGGAVGFDTAATYATASMAYHLAAFSDSSSSSKGDAKVAVKKTATGATATTQHLVNEHRELNAVIDFGAATDGTTSATTAIKAMFDAAATTGVGKIYFPPGTYLLTNPNTDADYTCAVVISGLRKCEIRGAKGTKFVVSTAGAGAAQFGMFRLEQCEDLEFRDFEMDGSGITINGTGANRSRGFVLVNYNVNSKATDLSVTNKRIEFHHIYCHDIGGFVGVPPRTSTLAATPYTDIISVHDCICENLLGQDHGVGCGYVRGLHIYNNRFVNDIATESPIDNMAVDASAGCEDVLVENNYVYGFVFGSKCETHINAGPASNETRPSKNVLFQNNVFDEIGDPANLAWLGDDTYGLKLNGINCRAVGNSIRARTVGVTTGGLSGGINVVNTHTMDSHCAVECNYIDGVQYGINHNDTTPTTRECTVEIRRNRIDDAATYGIICQANVVVEDNRIHRAGISAILVQDPDDTIIRRNRAFNCATTDNPVVAERVVFYQEDTGSVGFQEWVDNVIIDNRGASAAEYGYFLRAGTTYSNKIIFRPGYMTGLLTAVTYDKYVSALGHGMQRDGTTDPARREFFVTNNPSSTAPWDGMTWVAGDRGILMPPVAGSAKAWVCTVGGTPGTWVSEGNL